MNIWHNIYIICLHIVTKCQGPLSLCLLISIPCLSDLGSWPLWLCARGLWKRPTSLCPTAQHGFRVQSFVITFTWRTMPPQICHLPIQCQPQLHTLSLSLRFVPCGGRPNAVRVWECLAESCVKLKKGTCRFAEWHQISESQHVATCAGDYGQREAPLHVRWKAPWRQNSTLP